MFLWIKNNKTLLLCLTIVYVVGWFFQNKFLLNSDVSFLMHCSQILLQGGAYASDFLETNPPLILYLYVPCILLTKWVTLVTALKFYISVWSTLSLGLCAYFLRSSLKEKFISLVFFISLNLVFLVFPLSDFGQREHLTLILIMPYLMLVVNRLDNHNSHSKALAVLTGAMAGIGFSLKPFFFAAYALVEMYYALKKKSFATFFRMESFALYACVGFYLLLIVFAHQAYLKIILPLIVPVYYTWFTSKISVLLLLHTSIFAYFTLALYALLYPDLKQNRNLTSILCLALIGFWLAYLVQRINWYYHEIPFFSLTFLLLVVMFSQLILTPFTRRLQIKLMLFSAALGGYLFFQESYIYSVTSFPFFPGGFFCLLGWVSFCLLFGTFNTRYIKGMMLGAGVMLCLMAFYQYVLSSVWQQYDVALTIILFFLLLMYALPHQNKKAVSHSLLLLALGLLMFTYPLYRLSYVARYSTSFAQLYQQLIARMQPYKQRSTYYFTNTSEITYPLIYYTQQQLTSRFWSFMWLPELDKPKDVTLYPLFYKKHAEQFNFYVQDVIEDFNKHQPDYVFVDDRIHSNRFFYGTTAPDYLQLFGLNAGFSRIWKSYQYVELIDLPPLCRIKVYRRVSDEAQF